MACSSRACGPDESFATFDVMTRTDEESSSSLHLMHLLPIMCMCASACLCVCVTASDRRGHLFLESHLESWAQRGF